MAVQIQIDQFGSGAPAGSPGVAREDLVTGFAVTLSAVGGPFLAYQWSLADRPVNVQAGVQSAALLASPNASITNVTPIDQVGTYVAQLVVDSGSGLGALPEDTTRITFYAGATLNYLNADPAELPRRPPGFTERTEHNVPDVVFPGGNPRGWAEEWDRWFAVIARLNAGKSWARARVALPGGGPASLVGGNVNVAGVARVAQGIVDVVFATALPDANYAVDVGPMNADGQVYADTLTVNGFRVHRADAWGAYVDADFQFNIQRTP